MTSSEIRSSFLKFFEGRGHKIVPSSSVIPYEDPTLLFTNAGMNQFKDVFLGIGKRDYVRAADSQKCIRVSGKHNDLEEVGRDTYHHTFFEMLGNWSFGDYYKKEAIEWAWELLTGVWGLDRRRLYSTVFESDDEAEDLWKKVTDIDHSHILRFGRKDNFWEMGETGPCGPCSEIHIDLTDDLSGSGLVNAGDPRVMEIWNLVFIQYNRDESGDITLLPAKHVDTGMGFERICAVLQGKKSNYDTDIFMPIIDRISEISGRTYTAKREDRLDIAERVIADHIRMLSFAITDGGIPSNEGRGYVMRRILRRAVRYGRNLGVHEPFLHKIVEAVVESLGSYYPEIRSRQSHIQMIVKGEEESFSSTLDRGLEIFESTVRMIGNSENFPGEDAFKLYDTYGFPLDLTEIMAEEKGLKVDTRRFAELMEEQRARGRQVKSTDELSPEKYFSPGNKSLFVGYDQFEVSAVVLEIKSAPGENSDLSDYLVLDKTPFYAESGGQVGDTGFVEFPGEKKRCRVTKVFKSGDAIVHMIGKCGGFRNGMIVRACVDAASRTDTMRNHTATHLVHEALRRVLGDHLRQQGSLVEPERLRFDFNHFEKLRSDQIRAVEDIVNEKIAQALPVYSPSEPADWISIDEAKYRYPKLKMFFGEKYGDRVRVVEVKDFTWELCGGTHVKNTRDIQSFKIISESSIASGIRRIEAVTGTGFGSYAATLLEKLNEFDARIKEHLLEKEELEAQLPRIPNPDAGTHPLPGKVAVPGGNIDFNALRSIENALQERETAVVNISKLNTELKKRVGAYRVQNASAELDAMISRASVTDGFRFAAGEVGAGSMEELKSMGDTLRSKLGSGVGVLGALIDGKVSLVCVVTDDLIRNKKLHAGKIVGETAKLFGGGGGGKPHLAAAGGIDGAKLHEAFSEAGRIVNMLMKG